MAAEVPLEIILHIYQYVQSDITLEYFNCLVVQPKRFVKSILTSYYWSFDIKEKSKIFILEQVNTSRLDTIKSARLVCKSWAIGVDDVVNLTNCSFNYNSMIFNRLIQYGLSDDQYQAYRKFYNQLRIKDLHQIRLKQHFNIMSGYGYPSNHYWYRPLYWYVPSRWSMSGATFVERSLVSPPSDKINLDFNFFSRLLYKYADTDSVYVRKNKKIRPKGSDENSYLLSNDKNSHLSSKLLKRKSYRQNLLPKHNKTPKMKIYGKQYHR